MAIIGATLANGSLHPVTRSRSIEQQIVGDDSALMSRADFCDECCRPPAEPVLLATTRVAGGIFHGR